MSSPASSSRRSFLHRILRSKESKATGARSLAAYVSSEGSITQSAWKNMSIGSDLSVRLHTIRTLCAVFTQRRLEVSTLEAVYHQTKDLLVLVNDDDDDDDQSQVTVLQMLIALSHHQSEHLGLALRATFFRHIWDLGPNELTLDWLRALTNSGTVVAAFEDKIGELLVAWMSAVLNNDSSTLSPYGLLTFAQDLLRNNAAYVDEEQAAQLVHQLCIRACHVGDDHVQQCLSVLDAVLKYSFLPRSELLVVVTTICKTCNEPRLAKYSWQLMRSILLSHLGYATMQTLCMLLESAEECPEPSVVRGAIFCVAMGLWGSQRVDNLVYSPSAVLPAFAAAIRASSSAVVGYEALLGVHRLVHKYGRNLQQFTWDCVLDMLACTMQLKPTKEKAVEFRDEFNKILTLIEQLHESNEYSGSPQSLFALVETCADQRPDKSVRQLLDYRAQSIYPYAADWLGSLIALFNRYYKNDQRQSVRAKAVEIVQQVYMRFRDLYDEKMVEKVIIPLFADIDKEKDALIQYQSLNVLFDVAKFVSTTDTLTESCTDNNDLFTQIMSIIGRVLTTSITKLRPKDVESSQMSEDLDEYLHNLEIVICGISDVMDERWTCWPSRHILQLIDMLCSHVIAQYELGMCAVPGGDVRQRILSIILHIFAHPTTGQLGKNGHNGDGPVYSPFIVCADVDNPAIGDFGKHIQHFEWTRIAQLIIDALLKERCWPVLKSMLPDLASTLQCRRLVLTAAPSTITNLFNSTIALCSNAHRLQLPDSDETVTTSELREAVCPSLAAMISYADEVSTANKLCRIVQESVMSERSVAAVLATALCVLALPDQMAPLSRDLVGRLADMPASARMAIPLLELLSEAAGVPAFYRFFQEKHYKSVIDALLPFTNVDQFTTFIVASCYRILYRWFLLVPQHAWRVTLARHAISRIDRQMTTNGDDAQVDNNDAGEKSLKCLRRDTRATFIAFLRHFLFATNQPAEDDDDGGAGAGKMDSDEHWIVGDAIVSIRNVAGGNGGSTTVADVVPPDDTPSITFDDSLLARRRHQSAILHKPIDIVSPPPVMALDDSCIGSQRTSTIATTRNTTPASPRCVQVLVRHAFGKCTWMVMKQQQSDIIDGLLLPYPSPLCSTPVRRGSTSSTIDTSIPSPIRIKTDYADPCAASTFLHLCIGGATDHDTNIDHHVHHVPSGKADTCLRALRLIDLVDAREMHTVGVVYVAPDQTSEVDMLANCYGSDRYAQFTKCLGEETSVGGTQCIGGLTEQCGTFTYCYQDSINRVVFHVATLMPTIDSDPACNIKKRLIGNDCVTIVYNDSGRPYLLGKISGNFARAAIVVEPQDEHCLLITVQAKDEICRWLAAKRAVLSDAFAAILCRKLAMRAQLSVRVWTNEQNKAEPPYLSQATERLRKIRQFKERYAQQRLAPQHSNTFLDII